LSSYQPPYLHYPVKWHSREETELTPYSLKNLNPQEPYDLIFIDAQKSGYPTYLSTILSTSSPSSPTRLLRPGGLIVADNVLRRGIVADASDSNPHAKLERLSRSEYSRDTDVNCLKSFNDAMNSDPRLEAWLMPLFDGVGIARLLD
jgi:predicted O-methyltransferase YrrM